jgi:hypothetical protein
MEEYSGVNSLTSCPAACRYLVSAAETSASPPVFDSGAVSDAIRHTVRVIVRLPVYDVIAVIVEGTLVSSMRRFLIGLVVALLLVASIGVGVTVAKWPALVQCWHEGRLG